MSISPRTIGDGLTGSFSANFDSGGSPAPAVGVGGPPMLIPTTGSLSAPASLAAKPVGTSNIRMYPTTATGATQTIAYTIASSLANAQSQFGAGQYLTAVLSADGPVLDEPLATEMNVYIAGATGGLYRYI